MIKYSLLALFRATNPQACLLFDKIFIWIYFITCFINWKQQDYKNVGFCLASVFFSFL